ncbi:MAG TPA: universal stress protein, partial [Candidatus Binatia bacterium]|nr:universal stress protein [Candidatus Binatia bacterium]
YVRSLVRGLNVPVELLRVNDRAQLAPQSPSIDDREYLQRVAESFAGIADVKCTVELGNPPGIIVDLAAAQSGTLIAMATHGYSGAQRWLLGSVAEKVLYAATNPLLLVRPAAGETTGGEARLNTVLVPLDGSGLAEKVLPTVTEIATRLKLEVELVRVVVRVYFGAPDAVLPVFGVNIPQQDELWAQANLEATKYLVGKVEQLRAAGLPRVSSVLIDGGGEGAAAEIIDLARKTKDNLVAMSTHGRSGIRRWVMGSVAERVLRHSSDPVLLIRPRF